MERVLQRDLRDRGKAKKKAEKDFLNSWDIYYKKIKKISMQKNPNKFTITKNTNIDHIIKKLFN